MSARRLLAALLLGAIPGAAIAQDAAPTPQDVHEHVVVDGVMLTPSRDGTGTAWVPATTPMYGVHRSWRGWDLRVDGAVFLQGVYEPGERHRTGGDGTRQIDSVNWGMAMARRTVGAGRVGLRAMLSAEPWTVPGCGTLNYLATGEVCAGDTIHDRQQPHDLLMELAVDYERPLRGDWRGVVYAALSGEPALGPPGYAHRVSAALDPTGPITHHWLDATHVTFGVVTLGVHDQRWKLEVSSFNSRAPDARRTDLDLGRFDSVAGRVSYLATPRLALQVSAGRLREATSEFPIRSPRPEVRATASAMYHRPFAGRSLWASTVAVGTTHAQEVVATGPFTTTSGGALAESRLTLSGRHSVFVRAELLRMAGHHLHAHEYARTMFVLGKAQLGYVRHLPGRGGLVPGIGAAVSVSMLPGLLAPRYGGRWPPSVALFVHVRPREHAM